MLDRPGSVRLHRIRDGVLTYTDGSTQPFTLGFTDWATSTLSFGNTIAAVLPYYNTVGGQSNIARYLYYAEVHLDATKTVKSVTLPTTTGGQLHIFSVGTRSGVYYNSVGTSDDSNPGFGSYDISGYSYSAQTLKAAGIVPSQTFYFKGSTFAWPNVASGAYNNYTTNGQTIQVSRPVWMVDAAVTQLKPYRRKDSYRGRLSRTMVWTLPGRILRVGNWITIRRTGRSFR